MRVEFLTLFSAFSLQLPRPVFLQILNMDSMKDEARGVHLISVQRKLDKKRVTLEFEDMKPIQQGHVSLFPELSEIHKAALVLFLQE